MIKKVLIGFFCALLTGCIVIPNTYDIQDNQNLLLEYPMHSELDIENEHKVEYAHGTWYSEKKSIIVKKSFSPLIGTLSKKGFQNKKITIKSHFSADKWAIMFKGKGGGKEASGIYLLPPQNTIRDVGVGIWGGAIPCQYFFPVCIVTIPIGAAAGFLVGVGQDIYNLFYGIPAVIIKRPWYEYDKTIDLTKEILIPTPEFKKQCHDKKDTFIGNNSCLSCQIEEIVWATKDECERCPNREMIDSECRLKNK